MVILFTLLQALDSPNFEISSVDVENHSFFTSTIQSQNEPISDLGSYVKQTKKCFSELFFSFNLELFQ